MLQCRSRHQLSYQQAQDIADRRPLPPSFTPGQVSELRTMLDLLVSVTDAWRQRRLEVANIRILRNIVLAALDREGVLVCVQRVSSCGISSPSASAHHMFSVFLR